MFRSERLRQLLFIFFGSILLLMACRKVSHELRVAQHDAPMEVFADGARDSWLVKITPADDSSVDVNTRIVLTCNQFMDARKLNITSFKLLHQKTPVEGKFVYTDTSVQFIPFLNLRMDARYTVEAEGSVMIQYDGEVPAEIKTFQLRTEFITDSLTEYRMERRSQAVTDFKRDGSKMIQFGEYLYLYGGWSGTDTNSESHNDIYRSTGDLTLWEKMPDAPWQGRHTFGIGKLKGEVFVYGGDQNTEYFDVWKSSDGVNFQQVIQDLDSSVTSRLIYGTCTHRNKLYILGGQGSLDLNAGKTDVWTSPNGYGWRRLTYTQEFLGKNLAGAVASFNGKIWVVGGGYYGHPDSAVRWSNHVYSSPDGVSWTREPDAPWLGRQFADVIEWDDKLWMVAGHNGKNVSEIWYMLKDGTWIQYKPSNLFTARHASAVAVFNDMLVIACGDQSNDCWVIEKVK